MLRLIIFGRGTVRPYDGILMVQKRGVCRLWLRSEAFAGYSPEARLLSYMALIVVEKASLLTVEKPRFLQN